MSNFKFEKLPTKEEYQNAIKSAKDDKARDAIRAGYKAMQEAFNEEYPNGYSASVQLHSVELSTKDEKTCFMQLRSLKGAFQQLLPSGQISNSTSAVQRMLNAPIPVAKALSFACGGLGTVELTVQMVVENDSYTNKGNKEYYSMPQFRIEASNFTANEKYGDKIAQAAMNALAASFATPPNQRVVPATANDTEA